MKMHGSKISPIKKKEVNDSVLESGRKDGEVRSFRPAQREDGVESLSSRLASHVDGVFSERPSNEQPAQEPQGAHLDRLITLTLYESVYQSRVISKPEKIEFKKADLALSRVHAERVKPCDLVFKDQDHSIKAANKGDKKLKGKENSFFCGCFSNCKGKTKPTQPKNIEKVSHVL